jgi:hypothetical protein
MRTTLTLDDDLAMALHERVRLTGRSFKDVVNEVVRQGLGPTSPRPHVNPPTHDLGELLVTAQEADAAGMDPEIVRFLRVTEAQEAGTS